MRHSVSTKLTALAGVGLLGLSLAGCNASAPSAAKNDGGPSLILVTPEPAGSNPFLKLATDGVAKAAKAANGTSRVFESADISKVGEQLDAAVAAKPAVVAAVGFEFVDAITAVAPQNPDQKFLLVDACTAKPLPNVTCAVFREHEAVYLAGVEAGLLSKSNKIGAIVAPDTPQIRRFSDPFGAGAKTSNPQASFAPLYVGGQKPFNDPGRAKEQTLSLANSGVDVVIAASAAGNSGVFDAAKNAGIHAVGVDTNQCPGAPGVVLDNVLKEVDVVVEKSIATILAGEASRTKSYGLAEGAVTLTSMTDDVAGSGCVIAEHQDVIKELTTVRDRIVSGEVKVDDPAA